MTNKIVNGDYVISDGKLSQTEYIDELLQNAKILLTASRGCFYPDKNFGSSIKRTVGRLSNQYALLLARQALDTLDGVYVKQAELNGSQLCFALEINDEERQVTLDFESNI